MNINQQRIVMYLSSVESASCGQIIECLAMHRTTFLREVPELIESDFVYLDKVRYGKNLYLLTVDGKSLAKRLIRYQSTEGEIVKAPSINKMAGKYEPAQCYQRNYGNKQIPSRGYV